MKGVYQKLIFGPVGVGRGQRHSPVIDKVIGDGAAATSEILTANYKGARARRNLGGGARLMLRPTE
jgi:hypothetical protein